jgi:hypothetical protein
MPTTTLFDAAGRRRSPVTMPGYLCGRSPKNRGMRYPADPPRVEEIIAVMRAAAANAHGLRARAHCRPPAWRTARFRGVGPG